MRKVFAATALAGSIALTGLAVAPAAQAAPASAGATRAGASLGGWGTYHSGNQKAYTFGKTFRSGGRVHTHWHGKEFSPRKGYVWFRYEFKNGGTGKRFYGWNGSYQHKWSIKGIKKLYTYTCWGGKATFCGPSHRIY
ncbi:hypothetical protein [Nonomuraea candida]|uniref:hypothetical protein n=1 Tax=Nonomuraea candida TaxID=359159 RepID=UPI0005BAABCA|nr:hypothetical protein [Nonomuraea candida]